MKKVIFFITFILLMSFINKVYAKPIIPPVDDTPTPYVSELGGYGKFYKYSFVDPNEKGYVIYKMPYIFCLVENRTSIQLKENDNVTMEISSSYSNSYSITYTFAKIFQNQTSGSLNLTLGSQIIRIGSSFTHKFGDEIENRIENSSKYIDTYITKYQKNVVADKAGFYSIYSYVYFDAYIFQEFYVNMVNGYPQKVASGSYDIVFTSSDRYASYCEFKYSENTHIDNNYIENDIYYINNYNMSIDELLSGRIK